jgi:dihydroxyacid dehydratase/phosphogluconate dehydratase
VVLHISPEAAVGGPLALVKDGDVISLDIKGRGLNLQVDDAELGKRKAQWKAPAKPKRGYQRLYVDRVMQAEQGCDFDFLAER